MIIEQTAAEHYSSILETRDALNDNWAYMRYIEGINANGDPRVTILSFSEWLNDGKPGPVTVR